MTPTRIVAGWMGGCLFAALAVNACDYHDYDDDRSFAPRGGREPPETFTPVRGVVPEGGGGRDAGTSGAGGTSDVGPGVVTGGSTTACGALGCDDCRECAGSADCVVPVNACLQNPDCRQVLSCMSACFRSCGGIGECIVLCNENCTTAFDETGGVLNAAVTVFNCVCDSVCRFSCAGDEIDQCEGGFL